MTVTINRQAMCERIYAARKAKGFTQQDMADAIGVSLKQAGRYERDGVNDLFVLSEIAEALDVSVFDLIVTEEDEDRDSDDGNLYH